MSCTCCIQVWLRKGIQSPGSGNTEVESLLGTGWLKMVRKMKMVNVAPQDRVGPTAGIH